MEAILRLVMSIFLCTYAGSLLMSVSHHFSAKSKGGGLVFILLAAAAMSCLGTAVVVMWQQWTLEKLKRRLDLLGICVYAGLFIDACAQKIAGQPGAGNYVGRMLIATASF